MALKNFLTTLGSTLAGCAKIVLLSRKCKNTPRAKEGEEIVILGNGPSLNDTIANNPRFLQERALMAVNFFANAPIFTQLKPQFYVLADPHFFVATENDNVRALWENIRKITWDMTLFVPAKSKMPNINNTHLRIATFNMTPAEGFKWFENFAYTAGLASPRPRNVLIPSIMNAMRCGYTKIYIAGADHSWTKTISVDNENHVVSIQPHFYKEDDKELKRIRKDYLNYPLHQILHSFSVAFRSYHIIQRYATRKGIAIINITPDSFIDAFPRAIISDNGKEKEQEEK